MIRKINKILDFANRKINILTIAAMAVATVITAAVLHFVEFNPGLPKLFYGIVIGVIFFIRYHIKKVRKKK